MSEKKIHGYKSHGQRRYRKSEINLALFLFQSSHQGNHQDLNDVIFSDKIKSEKRWLVLNARDAEGMPILINCLKGSRQKESESDHLECMKILVSTGIPLDSKDAQGKTVIHCAVEFEKIKICTYLLQQGAPSNTLDNSKLTPMHVAINQSLEVFVKMLCEIGAPEVLETVDNMGRTPLCNAMFSNLSNIFLQLLTAGADANGLTNDGKCLLTHTIENNNYEFLNMLLKHKAKLFPNGANQFNNIHLAAIQKDPSSLQTIASYCTNVELQCVDNNGKTPLMYAVQNGLHENVTTLLSAKVDAALCDNEGKTALHYTSQNVDTTCVDLLLSYDKTILNKTNYMLRSAIHFAIMNNNQVVVRSLLDHGASINILDSERYTLIHYAAEYSAAACLAELISVGLSVNIPDHHNVYPAHYAVRLEERENPQTKAVFLKKLVESGIVLNVVDGQGLQPIHWAVCMGFTSALKILLIENVDVNAETTEERFNCLHLACNSSKLECLELLLQQPSLKIDQVDSRGYTPLMTACGLKVPKFTEFLLNAGADPDHQALDGKTPAHVASANAPVDCLWLLSLKKANFDVKSNDGETPIHVACMNPDEACIRFLLTRKCDVNAAQNNGLTALHIAVTGKNSHRASLLLQHGAKCDVILYGKEKHTPLDIALENGDHKCITLLQSYGARTSYCILSNGAIAIQHLWKRYKKRKKTSRHGVPFINTSSMCTSSNASESVSVMGMQKQHKHTTLIQDVNNTSEYAWVNKAPVEEGKPNVNVVSPSQCLKCGKFGVHHSRVIGEENEKAFSERIARGEREIHLMRQLMKEAEQMLVRANHVTEEADSIINSSAFRLIKQSNKEYIEEKRKKQQLAPIVR